METERMEQFIPQRAPILMVDALEAVTGNTAVTTLTVRPDNFFMDDDGRLAEAGLMEHIAQSASAWTGYVAVKAGAATPPTGYIGEIKNFRCFRRPQPGELLRTTVSIGDDVAGVRLVAGETFVGDDLAASTQMKIGLK